MKWTVLYRPSAQNHLANIWLNAPDQRAVAEAAEVFAVFYWRRGKQ